MLSPLRSLTSAIRQTQPDLILCDDERALALVRRLHSRVRDTDADLATLLARSVGAPADWPSITSRAALARAAGELDLAAPDTAVIDTAADLTDWITTHPLPVALKTDGSWGGQGVAIVRDPRRLSRAWQTISAPPGLPRSIKRAVFDLEPASLVARLRNQRPVVNAQQFVAGKEAIVTAACLDGRVISLVCLEVVQACEARGPAAVVRTLNHPRMADAARHLVARYGLSGFCGFDFILTGDGEAHLLEMNPRVTPTCYLLVEGDYERNRLIALFPNELARDPDCAVAIRGALDVPVRAPLLVDHGAKSAQRYNRATSRRLRNVKQKFSGSRR